MQKHLRFLLILLELIRIYPCLYESKVYNIQCQEMKGLTRCYVIGLSSDLLVCLKLTIAKFYDIWKTFVVIIFHFIYS